MDSAAVLITAEYSACTVNDAAGKIVIAERLISHKIINTHTHTKEAGWK